jgi:hypothetical protein
MFSFPATEDLPLISRTFAKEKSQRTANSVRESELFENGLAHREKETHCGRVISL